MAAARSETPHLSCLPPSPRPAPPGRTPCRSANGRSVVAAAVVGVVAATLAGCNLSEPRPFDPRGLGAAERRGAAALEQQQPADRGLQRLPDSSDSPFLQDSGQGNATTRPQQPPAPPTPIAESPASVALPLREVIARSVMNNGDVRVSGYTPAIEQTRIVEAQAAFDPVAFANVQYQRVDRLTTGQFNGITNSVDPVTGAASNQSSFVAGDQSEIYSGEVGLRQLLPSGGQAQLSYQTARNKLDQSRFTNFDSNGDGVPDDLAVQDAFWEDNIVLQLTQPLLRNFGRDVNQARISINRNNQQVALLDFRTQLEQTLVQVEQTYWRLAQTRQEIEYQEELLQRTVDTAQLLYARQNQDVNRQQVAQAVSEVESRTAELISLRSQARDLSDQLKRLMNDDQYPVAGPTVVVTASDPAVEPIVFDVDDQVSEGLANRPEIAQQLLRVRSAGTALAVGRNNLLPRLDLILSGGFQGVGNDIGSAFDNQAELQNFNATVGLQYEIPLGNREARAVYRRAQLQREQAIEQYRSLVAQITLDVKQALRSVETSYQLIVQRKRTVFAASEALESIRIRREAGEALTPTFVDLELSLQANLAAAQRQEAQSISDYNVAVATLERAKGTLLRYDNVILDEAPLADGSLR